ncbi:MAG: hypothetical protein JXQ23_11220, partial [Clostridia bacterium]|nr:hypothetical protein [Clostridia bacterium]
LALILLMGTVIYMNVDYIMFKYFIAKHYLYTGTLDKTFKDELGIDIDGKYYKYFDNLAIEEVSNIVSSIGNDPFTYQYTPKEYEDYVVWRETKAKTAYLEELTGNAIYMLFPNFTDDSYQFLTDSIETINKYSTLVIDLRGNGGGDLDVLFKICGLFVGNKQTVTIEKTRTYDRNIKSKEEQQIFVDKVILLVDHNTASASENLAVCLHELIPDTVIVGTDTYGKGIGQTRINLTKGFYSKATTLEWQSPSGVSIDKVGVSPDIYYTDEDIIDYVVENLLK